MTELRLADCINACCPFSGKPVVANSLTLHHGRVVGFCNPSCCEKFAANPGDFSDAVVTFDAIASH